MPQGQRPSEAKLHRSLVFPEGGWRQVMCRVADAGDSDPSTRATAGVGNWPRDEIAEGGAPRVRLALWGLYERGHCQA